jgi:hypothetical protein
MKRLARFCRVIPAFLTAVLLCGCSSWQLQEAGKNFAAHAAGQLLILGISGKDGLEDHNDRKERMWRHENNPCRPSVTGDELIESYQRAEQWDSYDSILSTQEDYIRRKLPDAPSNNHLACPDLGVHSFGRY